MKFEVKGKLSICKSGMDGQFLKSEKIIVEVSPTHPLIKLMNGLNWEELSQIILPDLKKSTCKLQWWLGQETQNPYPFRRFFAAAAFE